MVYDLASKLMVVDYSDKKLMLVDESGSVLSCFGVHAQQMRLMLHNCFVLHGPMLTLLALDSKKEPGLLVLLSSVFPPKFSSVSL